MPKALNTCDLISSSRRRGMIPSNDATFNDCDVIDILNEEQDSYVVPIILKHHEEYLVWREDVCIEPCIAHYQIPYRATGNKLRDIFYLDNNCNEQEMARISPDERTNRAAGRYSDNSAYAYYPENDEIILLSQNVSDGKLRMSYYLRPNALVKESRGGKVASIGRPFGEITITCYADLVSGTDDSVCIVGTEFTAQTGAATLGCATFRAATSNAATATSLAAQINCNDDVNELVAATICGCNAARVLVTAICTDYDFPELSYDDNDCNVGLTVSVIKRKFTLCCYPAHFATTCVFDFIKGRTPNKIYAFDITKISSCLCAETVTFAHGDLTRLNIYCSDSPEQLTFRVGDWIMKAEEAPVPQLPLELHSLLAQRAALKMQESMGDAESYKIAKAELADMEKNIGIVVDNRVDGSDVKVVNRKSNLSRTINGRYGYRNR